MTFFAIFGVISLLILLGILFDYAGSYYLDEDPILLINFTLGIANTLLTLLTGGTTFIIILATVVFLIAAVPLLIYEMLPFSTQRKIKERRD